MKSMPLGRPIMYKEDQRDVSQRTFSITVVDKAAVLGYPLLKNHPFLDGNKRMGHAAMEVFLVLKGYEIRAAVDEIAEATVVVKGFPTSPPIVTHTVAMSMGALMRRSVS
jgi:death-on-curing family protein